MGWKDRVNRLVQSFADQEIDAILISQPENRYYLSGFNGSDGYLLITPRKQVLATDFRYLEQAQRQSPGFQIFRISGPAENWFPELVDEPDISRLGFESRHITFYHYRELSDIIKKKTLPFRLVPVDGLIESLRMIKEPEEIELIARAATISDAAFSYAVSIIGNGISEQELAWAIERFMRERGSEPIPFNVIIGSGDNSALPHISPSPRIINPGEPVVMDFGARIGGYSSDLSRTIYIGGRDDTFRKVYDTVLGAQLTAIAMIKGGMSGEEADNIARIVIEEAGYGEAFGHSLGHGIGLSPHEAPRLGHGNTEPLTDGMVFTIEPGIYIPGWGGVRIEDTVVMEDNKVRVISRAEKIGV
ncbi:MAG: aminopeptidase P family protein [Dehalococcoidales bacterium]|nr:aminopeptidase P family protein [Dehalococcoidales bacterium]